MRSAGQSHKHSVVESFTNIAIGYSVALASQLIIFPLYDIHVKFETNLYIGLWFTAISLFRSYILRRFFNGITVKKNA